MSEHCYGGGLVRQGSPNKASVGSCSCGCPGDMHIGEIGCPCALPSEAPCDAQPDRCPSRDPYDTLRCGRRIHEDDQCQFGGIAWKKGAGPRRKLPPVLYHWSPSRNRASIRREGLRPSSPSNIFPEWRPPHVCYGETPATAHGLTLLDEPLDLWMVRTEGHAFALANDGTEWRSVERIEAWWVGSRPPRDPVLDMTEAEQAEADEVVAYLHEQEITRVIPPASSAQPDEDGGAE